MTLWEKGEKPEFFIFLWARFIRVCRLHPLYLSLFASSNYLIVIEVDQAAITISP